MDESPRFWDRIAERYARQPIADEAAYRRKLEVTRSYFRPDSEVLELGCGTGSTAVAHAPFVQHVRAIDASSRMLEIARRRACEAGVTNVTFERAAIDDLELPDRAYDVALALSILHLVEDREPVVAKVHRALKPGGVLVSSTACLGDWMPYVKWVAPIGRLFGLLPLVRVFTQEELETSLTAAGFDLDHVWQPGKRKAVFIAARKADEA